MTKIEFDLVYDPNIVDPTKPGIKVPRSMARMSISRNTAISAGPRRPTRATSPTSSTASPPITRTANTANGHDHH
jgi:hypothetical protein